MIPTKRVRRADGAEAIINAEDFDPALHEDLDAPKEAPKDAPKPKGKAAKPAPEPAPEPEIESDDGDERI
jgi:hypothetical protein